MLPKNSRSKSSSQKSGNLKNLKNQYKIIKEDLKKLRVDLEKGYDMARDAVENKTLLKELLKTK